MDVICVLTVFFEDPFWVGVYESTVNGYLEAAKVVFGAEPKDNEVYDYFLNNWSRLRFSPSVPQNEETTKPINPKRMQRAINHQLSQKGVSTKAQQALKELQEEDKLKRKAYSVQKSEEKKQEQFELRQQKKKEKHKGR